MTINSVLPAIVAGNAVLLKPSPQTPLVAERFVDALHKAGVPADLAQVLHLSPELTAYVVQHKLVDFVSFTGSVVGGRGRWRRVGRDGLRRGDGGLLGLFLVVLGRRVVVEKKGL